MKNICATLLFLIITITVFGQHKKIKNTNFQFRVKENYKLIKNDSSLVKLTDTLNVESYKTAQEIMISRANIDPEKNGITEISDFANLDKLSIVWDAPPEIKTNFEGLTEIGGEKCYFYYDLTEGFSDYKKKKLTSYILSIQYYFFRGKSLYRIQYFSKLINEEKSELEREKISKMMRKNLNFGDVNIVFESLKILK